MAPSTQSTLPLDRQDLWRTLPSPKMRRPERVGVYSWDHFYPAFSERFALAALAAVGLGDATVLDPFIGGGTTLVAAGKLGVPAVGIDIDPYSALLSRARLSINADSHSVSGYLERRRSSRKSLPDISSSLFSEADLTFADQCFVQVKKCIGRSGDFWSSLLTDRDGTYDSEVVALAAITVAATSVSSLRRGSNPVWFREDEASPARPANDLPATARTLAERMLSDLHDLRPTLRRRDHLVLNRDLLGHPSPEPFTSPVVLLTSPPYLNRLDYVMHHLAPLRLLERFVKVDIDSLRTRMIGTTFMTRKDSPSRAWGPTCTTILEKIRTHHTKASNTYYYPFYANYFSSLWKGINTIKQLSPQGLRGVMVLQNSFYKEYTVDLPQIVIEMCQALKIKCRKVREETVRSSLVTLNPKRKSEDMPKVLTEAVLYLEAAGPRRASRRRS